MPRCLVLTALLMVTVLGGGCAGTPASSTEGQPPVFYPPPPATPRLQFLGRFSGTEDIGDRSAFHRFVVGDNEVKEIDRAHGIAWSDGRLYVCDPGQGHLVAFDFETGQLRPITEGHGVSLKKPIDIAVAPDGFKYVTDTGHRQVLVFDRSDRCRGAFGDPEAWRPVGIAATQDRLYVTDVANHQLVVLDRGTGREIARHGAQGGAPGKFYYPVAVTVGPDGNVLVTDSFNFRVQYLAPDGTPVRSVGSVGVKPGYFMRPRGVAVDREGRVYVLDAAFENTQIFDREGDLLLFFGKPGVEPGAMNMPAAVEISYEAAEVFRDRVAPGYEIEYVVFVSSQTGPHKVNAYGFLRKK